MRAEIDYMSTNVDADSFGSRYKALAAFTIHLPAIGMYLADCHLYEIEGNKRWRVSDAKAPRNGERIVWIESGYLNALILRKAIQAYRNLLASGKSAWEAER